LVAVGAAEGRVAAQAEARAVGRAAVGRAAGTVGARAAVGMEE